MAWHVQVLDKRREPLFNGWFPSATAAGIFINNTLELFLVEHAEFFVVSNPDEKRRVEYPLPMLNRTREGGKAGKKEGRQGRCG